MRNFNLGFWGLLCVIFFPNISLAEEYDDIEMEISFDSQIERLWNDIPSPQITGTEDNINILKGDPVCAGWALARFRGSVSRAEVGPAAIKGMKITVKIGKELMKAFGLGLAGDVAGDLADLFQKYLDADSPEAFQKSVGEWLVGKFSKEGLKKIGKGTGLDIGDDYWSKTGASELAKALYKYFLSSKKEARNRKYIDDICGQIDLNFYTGYAEGKLFLYFDATGDCKCQWPTNVSNDQKLGFWYIHGKAELIGEKPVKSGKKVIYKFHPGKPEYNINASCGCPTEEKTTTGTQPPQETPPKKTRKEIAELICREKCWDLWKAWVDLQSAANEIGVNVEAIGELERQAKYSLDVLPDQIKDTEKRIQAIKDKINDYKKGISDIENRIKSSTRDKKDLTNTKAKWEKEVENLEKQLKSEEGDLEVQKNKKKRLEEEIKNYEKTSKDLRQKQSDTQAKADAARDAYYKCLSDCYKNAIIGGDIREDEIPEDVNKWRGEHSRREENQTNKRVSIGPKAAVNYSLLKLESNYDGNVDNLTGIGFAIGATGQYNIYENISAICNIGIFDARSASVHKTQTTENSGITIKQTWDYTINMSYLAIEPLAMLELDDFSIMLGPSVLINYSASQKTDGVTEMTINGNTTKQTFSNDNSIVDVKAVTAAIVAGIGYNINMGTYSLIPFVEGSVPLMNSINETSSFNAKNKLFSIMLGIKALFQPFE